MDDETVGEVRDVHPIIVCEGRAEEVIVRKLMDANALVYPTANIVDVTRTRRAADIQDGFLKEYWDVDSIKRAASEYKRRAVIPKGELCLADLIRYEGLR